MGAPRPGFADLVATMARLRAPGGCPWDRAQTPASLRPYLLEEAYETLDAIDGGDPARLREELGDLLLQVVFHAQMAADAGAFTIDDVVAGLVEKLIRRHPHVFGNAAAATPDAVVTRWEAIKQAERADAHPSGAPEPASRAADGTAAGALAGLTPTLPALMLAQQMQTRAARAGFAIPGGTGAADGIAGVRQALDDLAPPPPAAPAKTGRAVSPSAGRTAGSAVGPRREPKMRADQTGVEEAVGRLLFAAVGAAESLHVNAELALRASCERFRERFARLEALARSRGTSLADCAPDDLRALWREAGAAG